MNSTPASTRNLDFKLPCMKGCDQMKEMNCVGQVLHIGKMRMDREF